jgi:hypothetical protein
VEGEEGEPATCREMVPEPVIFPHGYTDLFGFPRTEIIGSASCNL